MQPAFWASCARKKEQVVAFASSIWKIEQGLRIAFEDGWGRC